MKIKFQSISRVKPGENPLPEDIVEYFPADKRAEYLATHAAVGKELRDYKRMTFSRYLQAFRTDRDAMLLLLTNAMNAFFAIKNNWNISTLLWIFLAQSMIIGLIAAIRVQWFSMKVPVTPVSPTAGTSIFTLLLKLFLYTQAIFFLGFYGSFHVIYGVFAVVLFSWPAWSAVFIGASLFLVDHVYSDLVAVKSHQEPETIITQWGRMKRVLERIVPMHLLIIVYGFLVHSDYATGILPLALFLTVKTLLDVKGLIDAKRAEDRQSMAKEMVDLMHL